MPLVVPREFRLHERPVDQRPTRSRTSSGYTSPAAQTHGERLPAGGEDVQVQAVSDDARDERRSVPPAKGARPVVGATG